MRKSVIKSLSFINKHRTLVLGIISVIAASAVHCVILSNYFFDDDFVHFYNIANTGFFEFFLTPVGGHLYLFRNVIFLIFFKLFGLTARPYFFLILLVHAVNVFLLYNVLRYITGRCLLAAFVAAFWGMCPINQGALSWFTVFGHVHATTFLLLLLFEIAKLNAGERTMHRGTIFRWYIYLFCMGTSWGIGLPIATFSALIAWLLLNDTHQRNMALRGLLPLVILMPLIYVGANFIYTEISALPSEKPIYDILNPDLLKVIVGLFGYGISSLLLGPLLLLVDLRKGIVLVGSGYTFPPLIFFTLVVALFGLCLYVIYRQSGKEFRKYILSMLFILLSSYGLIAAGRSFYFKFDLDIMDKISTLDRYHYLGQMIFSILLSIFVCKINFRLSAKVNSSIIFLIWIVLATYPFLITAKRVNNKRGAAYKVEFYKILSDIQSVAKKQLPNKIVYIENKDFIFPLAGMAPDSIFPKRAAVFMIAF